MMHIADNHDALLDYLYEEGDPAERLKIARHLQTCAACSVAVLEFQTVRGMLSEWRPPASQLGFRIVQDQPSQSPTPRHAWWAPSSRLGAWAQAAAAVLLFAAGVAVSQLNFYYADGALTVGARPTEMNAPAIRNASIELVPEAGGGLSRTDTNNGEPVRSDVSQTASATNTNNTDVERLLQRVRSMIEQSELRQQRELALRLSQVAREVDTQHRADLLRIQQNLGQFEMQTGAQIDQQQQIMDYLVRTAGGVK
jgi:anti-sigma factor RsiW